ncbi:exported hypothetical protein [Burkholderiales bacterium]|nr:exported hypothetical protein [Burkholderiales bacterium]
MRKDQQKGRHRRPFCFRTYSNYFFSSFFILSAGAIAPGAGAAVLESAGAGAGAGAAAGAGGGGGGGAGFSHAAKAATEREAAISNFFTIYSLLIINDEC